MQSALLPRPPGWESLEMADDPLIKSVKQTARVRDALKKPEAGKKPKQQHQRRNRRKKDSKRIIDTYA